MFLNNFSVRILPGEDSGNGYIYLKDKQQYSIKLKNNHDTDCQARISVDGQVIGVFYVKAKGSLEVDHPVNDDGKFTFYKTASEEGGELKQGRSEELSGPNGKLGLIQVEFVPFKAKAETDDTLKAILKYLEEQRASKTTIIYHDNYWWWKPYRAYPWWEYQPPLITYGNGSIPTNGTYGGYYVGTTGSNSHATMSCSVEEISQTTFTTGSVSSGLTGLSGESNIQYQKEEVTAPRNIDSLIDESNRTTISLRLVCKDDANYNKPRRITPFANPVPEPVV